MRGAAMAKVYRRRNEDIELLLKRFRDAVKKDGTLTKYLSRAAYMPPGEQRRSAANSAAKRAKRTRQE